MVVNESMYQLGSVRSAIRELFEYGKKRAAIVGKENVYDFSIGNPSIPAPHYHFVCNKCRCVLDIDTPADDGLEALVSSCFGGKIDGHAVLFNGLCPSCMSSEKNSSKNS